MSDVPARVQVLLRLWLQRQLPPEGWRWLSEHVSKLANGAVDRDLYVAIGLAPRRLGKADLALGVADLDAAATARLGWDPRGWSVDQAARILLLLSGGTDDADRFAARLEQIMQTADIGELICFYRGLPLYPGQERYAARAREGTRSGMRPIFEAVAHGNPYPREQFDDAAWNQMIVKALFIDSRLAPIQGLDERRNATAARMLVDYAHERIAAGRTVSPELWRCVGPFANGAMLGDLERALRSAHDSEQRGAALALAECPDPAARELLRKAPELNDAIASGRLTWGTLSAAA